MIEEIKLLLGDAASNYSDELIALCLRQASAEVEAYCNRQLDTELEMIVERIAVIRLQRMNTEGLSSQSFSGVSESYINGYPADILAVLNRKRKVKFL